MKKIFILILINLYSILLFSQKDSIFWFAAPSLSNIDYSNYDRPSFFKFSSFTQPAQITISMPSNTSFTPIIINLNANSHQSVDMTNYIEQIESKPANLILNKGILIHSTALITAYYENAGTNYSNPDIFTLKGRNALGNLFYLPFQNYSNNCDSDLGCENSSFDIVATENNTVVDITPTNNIEGHNANISFQIILHKGQVYSSKATSRFANGHLGGSKVLSNKPIAITMKDDLTNNYANGLCRDLIGDQFIPVEKCGSSYILVKGDMNIDDRFYICSTQPNTNIFVNGVNVATLINAGQMYAGSFNTNSVYINSSSPVCVLHTTGFGCEMGGAILPPLDCTGSNEIVLSRTTSDYFALILIAKTNSTNNFTLNNNSSLIPATAFSIVPNTSNNWSYAKISYSSSEIPINGFIRVKNSIDKFHLAVINGQNYATGCRLGFFSEINKIELDWVRSNNFPTNQFCLGDTVKLFADTIENSNYTNYLWSGPNNFQSNLQNCSFVANSLNYNGIYSVVANNGNCTTEPKNIMINIDSVSVKLPNDTNICMGNSIILKPIGSYNSLVWNNGSIIDSMIVNSQGTYWVKGLKNNCQSIDSIIISYSPHLQFSLGNDTTLCNSNSYVLHAPTGPYNYLWSNGNTSDSLSTNSSGVYWIKIEGQTICPSIDSINLNFVAPSIALPSDTTLCNNNSIRLIPTGNYNSLVWSTGEITNFINVSTAGIYWVKGIINQNCFSTDTIDVKIIILPSYDLGNDTSLCEGNSLILNTIDQYDSYLWNTGETTQSITVSKPGEYSVQTIKSGCIKNDVINILPCPCNIWAPNTFTPNNDDINDTFYLISKDVSHLVMKIYNRWGLLLFQSSGIDSKWDGTYKGQMCPDGVYFCTVEYKCDYTKDKIYKYNTSVTLIK